MRYCKDCKFRRLVADLPECTSPKITENDYDVHFNNSDGDRLIYSNSENGRFYVEDHFGCVHFAPNDGVNFLYSTIQCDSISPNGIQCELPHAHGGYHWHSTGVRWSFSAK